ncbi:PEP-CTERM sorting domain-containing protein [Coraliomargarita parva]|uniref:PEP-CTERM sorting domain-containing protein n=1 Tax=Coraliomargarita parva TaxID=3014050 RepID=UPI0022B2D50F|nr:PEP-CTERM sorting domain-containing protein [Coraliomargarita parva]
MKNLTHALLFSGLTLSVAQAEVIYSDNFDGAATSLNGVAPDVRPGSETWTSSNLNADGSIASVSTTSWLPYAFQNGMIYSATLASDIAYQASSTTPVYFGFTENDPFNSGNIMGSTQNTYGILAIYRGGGAIFEAGPNNDATDLTLAANNELFSSSQDNYEITLVLDTTAANWTLAAYAGGDSISGTQLDLNGAAAGLLYDFGGAMSFTGIGMGYHSATFVAENFVLATIPEPGTYALLGGFLAFAAVMLRRRLA